MDDAPVHLPSNLSHAGRAGGNETETERGKEGGVAAREEANRQGFSAARRTTEKYNGKTARRCGQAKAEDTTRLLDAADARELVTIVVRVEIREPEGKEFRGFVFFQKKGEKPNMWRWCFLVEQVLEGEIRVHYGEPIPMSNRVELNATTGVRLKVPRSRALRESAAE